MATLRIKHPDKGEVAHALVGDRVSIGRRPDNTIQIIDRTVSAHHAELIATEGHYRLHDLGSTNLTCVDGQPITDFHLHQACKVSFGTVEGEFDPAGAPEVGKPAVSAPTRGDLERLRQANLDLEAKIAAQQKQIEIFNSARLSPGAGPRAGITPEAHRAVIAERDELRAQVLELKRQLEKLKPGAADSGSEPAA